MCVCASVHGKFDGKTLNFCLMFLLKIHINRITVFLICVEIIAKYSGMMEPVIQPGQ